MANHDDVRRIASSLPSTTQWAKGFGFSVRNGNKEKGFVWVWQERITPKKPRVPNPAVLAVRVLDLDEKDMLLARAPKRFFTEPHYAGFPAILVRLPAIGAGELRKLITAAWRCQAPRSLVEELEGRRKPPTGKVKRGR